MSSILSVRHLAVSVLFVLNSTTILAQAYNVFEVDSDTIHSTSANNSFYPVTFDTEFENAPAIFTIGNTTGWNGCEVRMRSVSTTGFEVVCAEDSSYDGPHAALPFQYIATAQNQVINVDTNNGGTVTFASACKDVTEVQHNCSTGCDSESWNTFSFGHTFTNPPVVIANIQTINNGNSPEILPGDGITPMLSVAVGSISTTSAEIALDLNKENNITLANSERICVLAVEETSNCNLGGTDNTLDFSPYGGPSSVAFESIISGEVLDGWGIATNNQNASCNNGEQVNFTSGCFTNTPVAVATKRSRNEAEGWLRYCQLNTSRLRVTIDEQRTNPADPLDRQHVNESMSVMAFDQAFTTPVSLSKFYSDLVDSKTLVANWITESESFNIGFNLWGSVSGEWLQLNKELITAKAGAFSEPKSYSQRLILAPKLLSQIEALGLSSIDNSGYEEFFGPFNFGQEYGDGPSFEAIEWTSINRQVHNKLTAKGYKKSKSQRWIKATDKRTKRVKNTDQKSNINAEITLVARQTGIHSVTGDQILEVEPELNGASVDSLAITFNGKPVPREVISDDQLFSSSDRIIFFVPEPEHHIALYTSAIPYKLSVNKKHAIPASTLSNLPTIESRKSNWGLQQRTQGEDKQYLVVSQSGDPWYDTQLVSTGNRVVSKAYSFTINEINPNNESQLELKISGGIALPGNGFDHHIRVYVNGEEISDLWFDEFEYRVLSLSVSNDLLRIGSNEVLVELVGDTGKVADIVYIDEVSLSTHIALNLGSGDQYTIQATQDDAFFAVKDADSSTTVHAVQSNGNLARVEHHINDDGALEFGGLVGDHLKHKTQYVVTSSHRFISPEEIYISNETKRIRLAKTNYLIVSHPTFIGEDLERFKEFKETQGYEVKIVDWLEVVENYGYGLDTPQALKNFLKKEKASKNLEYILLVGGHTYDYKNNLGQGNVTFIPADYEAVNRYFEFAPTDHLYSDLNGDGRPNLAIGRWPAREIKDLVNIIQKTIQWEEQGQRFAENTLLITDAADANSGQDFKRRLESMLSEVNIDTNDLSVRKVYLDDYIAGHTNSPIAQAQQDLLSHFETGSPGIGLTIYNGHASTSRWTYRNLFNASDVAKMRNINQPTNVMPLACYTTYYETPSVNSLAHQLLFDTQGGAAMIAGASYLSDDRENALVGGQILKLMRNKKMSWGKAMQRVKSSKSSWDDAMTNWTLLGDPSLRLFAE